MRTSAVSAVLLLSLCVVPAAAQPGLGPLVELGPAEPIAEPETDTATIGSRSASPRTFQQVYQNTGSKAVTAWDHRCVVATNEGRAGWVGTAEDAFPGSGGSSLAAPGATLTLRFVGDWKGDGPFAVQTCGLVAVILEGGEAHGAPEILDELFRRRRAHPEYVRRTVDELDRLRVAAPASAQGEGSIRVSALGTGPKGDPIHGAPIVISLGDDRLQLTDLAGGVTFDIDADGVRERMAWTAASSGEAFLVLDRDQDGEVDHGMELLGDHSPQLPSAEANGFRALAVFDDPLNGGNGDAWIDGLDPIFQHLQTWTDSNHDGVSQPEELRTLPESGIEALGTGYRSSGREDEHGNQLRYNAPLIRSVGPGARRAWDVFFLIAPEE